MRKLLLLCACCLLLASGCKSMRGCDCPSFSEAPEMAAEQAA